MCLQNNSNSDLNDSAMMAVITRAAMVARPKKLRLGYHKYFETPEQTQQPQEEGKLSQPVTKTTKSPATMNTLEHSEENEAQNTILNDLWEESYSDNVAILESLIMQDRLDAIAEKAAGKAVGDNDADGILTQLRADMSLDADLDGVNEILDTIEKFMDTYKRYASESIIDHTSTISEQFSKYHDLTEPKKPDGGLSAATTLFEQYLNTQILHKLQKGGAGTHLILESPLIKSNQTRSITRNRYCKLTSTEILVFISQT